MTTSRRRRIEQIRARLAGRKIVWVGTRGTDARPLLEFREFAGCFSIVAPLGSMSLEKEACLETEIHRRVNLDAYDFDRDSQVAAVGLRRSLKEYLGDPCVLVPYRPLPFLSTISFTERSRVQYFGPFYERHSSFEHKPWVEGQLKSRGVPVVPWKHYSDDDMLRLSEALVRGPLVLRRNRSSGGAGLRLVSQAGEAESMFADDKGGFLSASPYLNRSLPLNVSGCVFGDGSVSLHAVSIQLIGIPRCTGLTFGYCGNDFTGVGSLPTETLNETERVVRRVGAWLYTEGYLGVFGVDLLALDGRVLVSELNPRFQGSSDLSSRIDAQLSLPDLYMDHLAAFLGLSAPDFPSLVEFAESRCGGSQIIVHNLGTRRTREIALGVRDPAGSWTRELVPDPHVEVDPGAVRYRIMTGLSVTLDGHSLQPDFASVLW